MVTKIVKCVFNPSFQSDTSAKGVIFSTGKVAQARLAPHGRSGALTYTTQVRTEDGAALPRTTRLPRRKNYMAPSKLVELGSR